MRGVPPRPEPSPLRPVEHTLQQGFPASFVAHFVGSSITPYEPIEMARTVLPMGTSVTQPGRAGRGWGLLAGGFVL